MKSFKVLALSVARCPNHVWNMTKARLKHACMDICMDECMDVCIDAWMHACIHACNCAYIPVCILACIHHHWKILARIFENPGSLPLYIFSFFWIYFPTLKLRLPFRSGIRVEGLRPPLDLSSTYVRTCSARASQLLQAWGRSGAPQLWSEDEQFYSGDFGVGFRGCFWWVVRSWFWRMIFKGFFKQLFYSGTTLIFGGNF